VNCAGVPDAARVVGKHGPFPLATFRKVVEVNLIGTFNVIRLAAERISSTDEIDGERGVIVNTASIAGVRRARSARPRTRRPRAAWSA